MKLAEQEQAKLHYQLLMRSEAFSVLLHQDLMSRVESFVAKRSKIILSSLSRACCAAAAFPAM